MATVINITKDAKRENRGTAVTDPKTGITTITDREAWIVQFAEPNASQEDARTAILMSGTSVVASIPRNGDVSTNNSALILRQVDAIMDVDSPFAYRVTGEFSSNQFIGGTAAGVDIQVRGSMTKQKNFVTYDGHNVVNTAGDFLKPLTDRDFYDEQITISWVSTSVASIVPIFRALRGKVCDSNGASFSVHGQSFTYTYRQLKFIDGAYGVSDSHTPSSPWKVSIEFLARQDAPLPAPTASMLIGTTPNTSGTNANSFSTYTGTVIAGFTDVRANIGLNYLDNATNKTKVAFMTKFGTQQTEEQHLDKTGHADPITDSSGNLNPPYYIVEPIEYEATFSTLTALIPT